MGRTDYSNQQTFEELKDREFSTIAGCYVKLIDVMGSDESIAHAARLSYGKGTRHVSEDRKLIRHLFSGDYDGRIPHSSPFEQAEIQVEVVVPMDTWRQWIRHRTANVNEYSTRYSEAIDETLVTAPGQWRLQSTANKQGSSGFVEEWPEGWQVYRGYHDEDLHLPVRTDDLNDDIFVIRPDGSWVREWGPNFTPGGYLSKQESLLSKMSRWTYEERLAFGVAREQARKDLPLSTFTKAIWKCDLWNIFHFLKLRMDKHAQIEIRRFADVIGLDIVKPLFPLAWEAFEDWSLLAMVLSAIEQAAIRDILRGASPEATLSGIEIPRERRAAEAKLRKLGIIKS